MNTNTQSEKPDSCTMVVFGATGDLTKRLLMPAVYNLSTAGLLPAGFQLIGVAMDDLSSEEFADKLRTDVADTATRNIDPKVWSDAFQGRLHYVGGNFNEPQTYQQLKSLLDQLWADAHLPGNCLFYFATPPSMFAPIVHHLSTSELTREEAGSWRQSSKSRLVMTWTRPLR